MSRLILTIENNAVSFAENALSNAVIADEVPMQWKFAMLSLVQAIELSLKEVLRREHHSLIYVNVANPVNTVGIDQATRRLKNIAGIEITKKDRNAVKTAIKARNNIIHHQVDESINELKLTFSRLLGFLNEFHEKYIDEAIQEKVDSELWRTGAKIMEYGKELYKRALKQMEQDDIDKQCLITCPMCGWEALCAFDPKQDTCYVCGWIEDLGICDRCNKVLLADEQETSCGKTYCYGCLCYVTDDYWYEQSVGK